MPKSTEPLTPAQVYRFAVAFCQPHLAFRSVGKVTSEVLFTVLFAAAVHLLHLRDLPPPQGRTLRGDLCQRPVRQPLLPLGARSARSTPPSSTTCPVPCAAAQAAAPPRRRPDPLALITASTPWRAAMIYRSQAKRGTNSFFAYATAYLVLQASGSPWPLLPSCARSASRRYSRSCCSWLSKAGSKPGLVAVAPPLLLRGVHPLPASARGGRSSCQLSATAARRSSQRPQRRTSSSRRRRAVFRHTLKYGKKDKATVCICVKPARGWTGMA